MIPRIVSSVLIIVMGFAMPAVAQDAPEETPGARTTVETAREARKAGRFDDALAQLEAALHADSENGLILYERVLTLEAMGEFELALQVVEAKRDLIIRHPQVNDLAVVEQRLISARDTAQKDASEDNKQTAGPAESSNGIDTGDKMSASDEKRAGEGNAVASEASSDSAGSTTPAFVAISVGTLAVSAGVVLVVLAQSDANALACAGLTPAPGCSESELDPELSRSEFEQRSDSVSTRRLAGGLAIGAGAAAIGWGLYDLFNQKEEKDTTGVQVSPINNGITVSISGVFP